MYIDITWFHAPLFWVAPTRLYNVSYKECYHGSSIAFQESCTNMKIYYQTCCSNTFLLCNTLYQMRIEGGSIILSTSYWFLFTLCQLNGVFCIIHLENVYITFSRQTYGQTLPSPKTIHRRFLKVCFTETTIALYNNVDNGIYLLLW